MSMKLRLLAALSAALALSSGVAVAQTAAPSAAPSTTTTNRTTLGYALGYRLARGLAENKVDVDVAALVRGTQDGYAKKDPTVPMEQLRTTLEAFSRKMAEQEKAEFDRVSRENKQKSDAFMATNKSKPGVTSLPDGVQYRVIEPGAGTKPTSASTVSMNLRSSLSTGQALGDSNGEAVTVKMSELPPELAGVKEVLMLMPTGARYEIYVPASKAYGDSPRSPIGPNQALVFEVRLVSVK
jgi:peptidylprolyl isomerase